MDSTNGLIVDAIPDELRQREQWVCWRLVERNGKPDKPPFIAGTDSFAASNKPQTWRPFGTALTAYRRGGYSGIGYVFTKADCHVGIDLDACRNPETGELAPWAAEVVSLFQSYTEVSPSGYGVKVICRGSLPANLRRNKFIPKDVQTFGPKEPEIAIFDHGRYFTITGDVFGEYCKIEERQEAIYSLIRSCFTDSSERPRAERHKPNGQVSEATASAVEQMLRLNMQDGSDGSRRLVTYCCRCVEADLSESDALNAIRAVEQLRPFPRKWSDEDIRRRLSDAEQKASRGSKTSLKQRKAKKQALVLTPYRQFPGEALPHGVGRFVSEAATAIGCDPSFIALPTLGCLARAIGNKRTIRLKKTWDEPSIIWAAIVGKSGTHKSPAIKAAMAALQRKQAEAIEQHKEAVRQYALERARYERDLAAWKRSKTTDPPPWEPGEPVCQRFIVSDITIEALADRLDDQFDGVLLVRDELAGWINGIAEYKGGKGSDTGHWLATWSGEPLTVDRKTGAKKTIHVPRAAVSIFGGIQPGILRKAIGREHMQDGLCARLLLAMPEQRAIKWTDDVVGPATYQGMNDLLERLLALEPAADADGKPAPFPLTLSSAAKSVWVAYYNRHRAEQMDLDDDLAAAWSKLEAYTARFALVFQLCRDPGANEVDGPSVAAAITVSEWFAQEARRVYGVLAEEDEDREQRELVEWIRRRGGLVTVRELSHGLRRFRGDVDGAEAVLIDLAKSGHGEWLPVPTSERGGKPTRVFRLVTSVSDTETEVNTEERTSNGDGDGGVAPDNEEVEWTG